MSDQEVEELKEAETIADKAKMVARHNLRSNSLTLLRRWWTDKYHRSPKSAEFREYTIWELLVEFFEDYYAADKKRMWRDDRETVGEVRLPKTGDALIDRWNEQIEKGIDPDLTEGMLPEERERIKAKMREIEEANREHERAAQKAKEDQFFEKGNDIASAYMTEFTDDYTS